MICTIKLILFLSFAYSPPRVSKLSTSAHAKISPPKYM
jgi:hypothetical protein